MAVEIERKFLVKDSSWRTMVEESTEYRQSYLSTDPDRTVRVRTAGHSGLLTIKGRSQGAQRAEYEYNIPFAEACEMIDRLCIGSAILKTRHQVPFEGHLWEVDQFKGQNTGLVVAEIELESEKESFVCPPWLGQEVTQDHRYFNAYLYQNPFGQWDKGENV